MSTKPLNDKDFIGIIRNTPLVAIDLIIRNHKGEVLLGFRKNGPAKAKWFVPGGRIRKNERLNDAFKRITFSELNRVIERKEAQLQNVYEHIYRNESKFEVDGLDTHYVVLAYVIKEMEMLDLPENDQHSKFEWMKIDDILKNEDVHIHTKDYFLPA